MRIVGDLPEHKLMLLFDAQTSGGLLIALPLDQREAFAEQMEARQAPWWEVGQVGPREDVPLIVHA